MSAIATAIVGGAVVGGIASNQAAKKGAKAATNANQATLDQQQTIADQTRADFEPFRQIGLAALPQYRQMLGLPAEDGLSRARAFDAQGRPVARTMPVGGAEQKPLEMELSPIGEWTLQESLKMQNRQDAARGLSGSGGASSRAGELGMQVRANDYQAQYGRILDALKLGTGASEAMGNVNQNLSNQVGQAGANNLNIIAGKTQANMDLWSGLGSLPADYLSISKGLNKGGGSGGYTSGYKMAGSPSTNPGLA